MHDLITIMVPVVVAQICVFLAIVFIMKRILLSDTMQAVATMRQVENEVRKKEETIRREIEEHEKEFAKRRVEAEETLQRDRENSEKEVAKLREQTLADAKREADGIIDQAKRNEEKLRKQIAQDMEEKAVNYGIEVFRMVFSEKMNEQLNKQFIDELLDAIEQIDSSAITVDAGNAEFTSSHPLLPEQKQRLEKLIEDKFHVNIRVNEKIKEDLIAGLIFKLGSLEIDGSLLNRMQEASAEVKKNVIG